jgi:hypothetical protein
MSWAPPAQPPPFCAPWKNASVAFAVPPGYRLLANAGTTISVSRGIDTRYA